MKRLRRTIGSWASAVALWTGAVLSAAAAETPLPDGQTTRAGGAVARLIDPTDRYGHGILGDGLEAGGLSITVDGKVHRLRLEPDMVFEDLRVRLVDLDGDGAPEALVVRTDLARGSAIAVYRISAAGIEPLAESRPIGRSHRWLNPVGVADFAGTGERLVAAVVTPHVAGSLRFYRREGRELVEVGRLDGVTNHIAGTRDLDLGCMVDIDRDRVPEVVLPSQDRGALVTVSFAGGRAVERRRVPLPGRIAVLACTVSEAAASLEGGRSATVELRTGRVSAR
ncbi:hypothetical protein [Pinisolibacter sp.]|uniref:hypothetical protein n=1 Tax=Pinisolibacter sp. TaxID=2172024 RepID=UPI002FDDE36C